MADINHLTTTVIDRERDKLNQDYESFKQSTKEQTSKQKESIKQDYVTRKLKTETQLQQEFDKAKSSLANKQRDLNLQVKQTIMNQYIQDVKKAMEQLDASTVTEMIESVVNRLDLSYGSDQYELVFGEKTSQLLGAQVDLPINLAEETIPQQAGFVIRQGSIEYNYLFDKLVEEQTNALRSLIVNEVFTSN
ncbi:hypothetical protein ACF3NG_02295 [Aerococcaceae bacterium WGS1372]